MLRLVLLLLQQAKILVEQLLLVLVLSVFLHFLVLFQNILFIFINIIFIYYYYYYYCCNCCFCCYCFAYSLSTSSFFQILAKANQFQTTIIAKHHPNLSYLIQALAWSFHLQQKKSINNVNLFQAVLPFFLSLFHFPLLLTHFLLLFIIIVTMLSYREEKYDHHFHIRTPLALSEPNFSYFSPLTNLLHFLHTVKASLVTPPPLHLLTLNLILPL